MTPEQLARQQIDSTLEKCGWTIRDYKSPGLSAGRGIAQRAVTDGVNVGYDVYRIKTDVGERGGKVEKGFYIDRRSKDTRKRRWEQLDEDLEYTLWNLPLERMAEMSHGLGPYNEIETRPRRGARASPINRSVHGDSRSLSLLFS